MNTIYQPSGKAREYSPWALNIYNGCDHGCTYCYVPAMLRANWHPEAPAPRPGIVGELRKQLAKGVPREQVLLCFTCDPYGAAESTHHATRQCLEVLNAAGAAVAILTKGGTRCLEDIPWFKDFGPRIKVGATLTFFDAEKSKAIEPRAASPMERLAMLRQLHAAGIQTWASIEPVLDHAESIAIIRASLPDVDAYKIGRLNHVKNNTNWLEFLRESVALLRQHGKRFYIKEDLRAANDNSVQLTAAECDQDSLALRR